MFKAGDKVRCMDTTGQEGKLVKGRVYTVLKDYEVYADINHPKHNTGWFRSRFINQERDCDTKMP